MHRIAEEGIAAHWKYKEGKLGTVEGEEQFRRLRKLIESQNEISDPREFLSNLKIDLYPDEVYCFTPKGEVITLPREATPVDFAYAIHTEVVHHCVAAKVNTRIVPLRHKLRNGEIVEVVTTKDASPSRDWLTFVKTARARGKIKHYINQRRRTRPNWQKLMEKESRIQDHLEKVLLLSGLDLAPMRAQKPEDIYPAVGLAKACAKFSPCSRSPRLPKQSSASVYRPSSEECSASPIQPSPSRLGRTFGLPPKCCNPIRGDEIIGYITRGKGISVHTTSCPNVANFLGSDRITDVEWVTMPGEELFGVRLSIAVEDRQGILAEITSAISNLKTNIRESRAFSDSNAGMGTVEITVDIQDETPAESDQGLKAIRGIQEVERVSQIP
jgi:GTP pyrophosphokinase